MNGEWDNLDPFEGAIRPDWIIPTPPPLNREYKKRRRFEFRWWSWALPEFEFDIGPAFPMMSVGAARAFLDARITWMRSINDRFRQHQPKVCYFDELPIDARTGLPPGEREQ